ncbi:MAG: ATP-dependent helicase HrpB [Verrucomicrobiota bacterium]|nr:ATP-dependent helicase HrpB [Verrucomicrobiota bacterium]
MNSKLPIYEIEQAVIQELPKHRRVILQAPTGSGKSTQIPQMLLDHHLQGNGQIIILQPRRLATRMLAARVAAERHCKLGDEVGYQIRFEDVSSGATKIKFVTEGILLRRMLTNPELKGIGTVIFDEFHERHLYGDISLARAFEIQATCRPDLNILVMSATLGIEPLQSYLAPCSVLSSSGRTFPVNVQYLDKPPYDQVWDTATQELEHLVLNDKAEGDVLIFMPGTYEISRTINALRNSKVSKDSIILPLHGELSTHDQDAAVTQYDKRKIIVSTNVAETSLTIDGVRIVIDSGQARIARFDPHRGINTLFIEKISQASAEQRRGRAGRTAPGMCLRLWTEKEHCERSPMETPEINRLDLSEVILTLKASGINDVTGFRWLESPHPRQIEKALTLLTDLGALSKTTGEITKMGHRMLSFPVHPRYARMLLAAQEFGCVQQACLMAALTQGRGILIRNVGKQIQELRRDMFGETANSDFFILMRAWTWADKQGYRMDACQKLGVHAQSARQVRPLLDHFLHIAKDEGLSLENQNNTDEALQKCILAGFSDQVGHRVDKGTLRCHLVHNRKGVVAKDSIVTESPYIVAAEVSEIESRDKELTVNLSLLTRIEMDWLKSMFPEDFSSTSGVSWDDSARRVVSEKKIMFRDLTLESVRSEVVPQTEAAHVLATEVLKKNLTLKEWSPEVEQWILRLNCLAQWCPDLGLPTVSSEEKQDLIEQICFGSSSYKEIKDKPVWPVLKAWLNPAQLPLLDKYVPERLELPSGRKGKIEYSSVNPPVLSSTIQNLFGLNETPKIAMGTVPLVIEILAPNQRPVQVTSDLKSFWSEHYPKLKLELQRKYPKHEWR